MDNDITCYICQENSNPNDETFAPENICNCKGSLRIHKKCFNILPNKNNCTICKNNYNIPQNSYRERIGSLEIVEEIFIYGSKAIFTKNKNDLIHGNYTVFYDNGTLWEISSYENGIIQGERTIFNRSQTKKIIEMYDDEGDCLFKTKEINVSNDDIFLLNSIREKYHQS
jgi:hypothetical protein